MKPKQPTKGDCIMNIIGNFKLDGENYTGSIQTLPFTGPVTLEPVKERINDDTPDYRMFTVPGRQRGKVHLAGAWKARSQQAGKEYLNLTIDEPSFPAPIYCRLIQFEGQEDYSLVWSRS
jgi:uncharacterized protein (DUF736 family)